LLPELEQLDVGSCVLLIVKMAEVFTKNIEELFLQQEMFDRLSDKGVVWTSG
jgi:hypothetical protein